MIRLQPLYGNRAESTQICNLLKVDLRLHYRLWIIQIRLIKPEKQIFEKYQKTCFENKYKFLEFVFQAWEPTIKRNLKMK